MNKEIYPIQYLQKIKQLKLMWISNRKDKKLCLKYFC
jgi:hypothetical protein